MRALVVTSPRVAGVQDVAAPVADAGELVVDVERVGICGTDVEFYTGDMAYLDLGYAEFPLRLGHEWTGRVRSVGDPADAHWIGKRITGDTMLGCGACGYCRAGHQHVCPNRYEVGIRGGWPGALAEQLVIPTRFAFEIPEHVSLSAAALVEPAGNSLRAVRGAALAPGHRVLVLGSGTIGPLAVRLTKPAGRVVFIGLSAAPSLVDTRDLALQNITAVGVLSASGGLAGAIEAFASGAVVPDALVSEVVGLEDVPSRFEGRRGADAGPGPKVHVDPRR